MRKRQETTGRKQAPSTRAELLDSCGFRRLVAALGVAVCLGAVPAKAVTCATGTILPTPAPHSVLAIAGQPFSMDAVALFQSSCSGGTVQYRFSGPSGLLRDWSDNPTFVDVKSSSTRYTVDARCSVNTTCLATNDEIAFTHSPLGGASLSVQPNGHLVVSNIGSSGQDGALIDLSGIPDQITQMVTEFEGDNFGSSSPTGATEIYTVHANVPGGIACRTTLQDIGNNKIEVRPEVPSAGETVYTVSVFNGTSLTGVFSNLANATVQTGDCVEVEID